MLRPENEEEVELTVGKGESQPGTQAEGEGEGGGAHIPSTAEAELINLLQGGPQEILAYIEESFGKMEASIKHNNQVLQQKAQHIMGRVSGLEANLLDLLRQLEHFSDTSQAAPASQPLASAAEVDFTSPDSVLPASCDHSNDIGQSDLI